MSGGARKKISSLHRKCQLHFDTSLAYELPILKQRLFKLLPATVDAYRHNPNARMHYQSPAGYETPEWNNRMDRRRFRCSPKFNPSRIHSLNRIPRHTWNFFNISGRGGLSLDIPTFRHRLMISFSSRYIFELRFQSKIMQDVECKHNQ